MNKHFASYNIVILCVDTRSSITRTIWTQLSEIGDWNTVRFFLATRGKLSKTEVEKASTHLNPVRQVKSGAGENRCHGGQSRPQHAQHCHLISLKASLLCLRRWFLAVSLRLSAAFFSSILLAHRQRNCYSKRGSRRDPGEDSASHTDVFEARSFSTLAKSTCHGCSKPRQFFQPLSFLAYTGNGIVEPDRRKAGRRSSRCRANSLFTLRDANAEKRRVWKAVARRVRRQRWE